MAAKPDDIWRPDDITIKEVWGPERWHSANAESPAPSISADPGDRPSTDHEILTIAETAHLLRHSLKGLYRLAVSGALPGALKIGGRWAVRRSELLNLHPRGRVPPGRTRR